MTNILHTLQLITPILLFFIGLLVASVRTDIKDIRNMMINHILDRGVHCKRDPNVEYE